MVLLKAMEDLDNPVFVDPAWPVSQYMKGVGGARVQRTESMTADGI